MSFHPADALKLASREAGFELAGIAPIADFPELEAFPAWISAGYAGEMNYLEARDQQGNLKRASLRATFPWARSVVVCAINYNTAHPYSTQVHDSARGWVSRYAWSREDYHDSVLRRLRVVEEKIRTLAQSDNLETRCYVDTGPLLERVVAKHAGIGWIGKNTCILNQKMGSWLFLGVILTSLDLAPDLPAPDRCGTCTRCIQACPTDAFVAPYQLDSNKCISYLTIEKRGAIPEALRAGMGHHVFGCDICQDVCPWNRKAPATTQEEFQPRENLFHPPLDGLAAMSAEEFRSVFRGSPIRRAQHAGMRRNAILAMGNSRDQRFIPQLEKLAASEGPAIAEAAKWALGKLRDWARAAGAKT
jgi:epoxyqueuosine reductase